MKDNNMNTAPSPYGKYVAGAKLGGGISLCMAMGVILRWDSKYSP